MVYRLLTDKRKAALRWYYNHREECLKQAKKYKRLTAIRNMAFVRSLKEKPCTDCKKRYPFYVMEFDHLPQFKKSFSICRFTRNCGFAKLKSEIAKCELVCANCHAVRTYNRGKVRVV